MNVHSIAHFIEQYYPEYYSWNTYVPETCATIHKVEGEWGALCNFGDTPLTVNGVTFRNAEQLFQMMKFRDAEPLKDLYGVSGLTIKMKAKKWEKTHRREDWGGMIVDALKFCLMQKHEQCQAFREALDKSKGLNIVEDQTSNNKKTADTWGVKLIDGKFEGSNLLGRLLMELRDNGKLEYQLPDDALNFIELLK